MKQLQKIVLVVVMLFFTTSQGYVSASSATATYVEKAYVGAMVGVMTVAGVATATNQWVMDNIDDLTQTAVDTWAVMSPDLKQNFQTSMQQGGDLINLSSDLVGKFLTKAQLLFTSGAALPSVPLPGSSFNLPYYVYFKCTCLVNGGVYYNKFYVHDNGFSSWRQAYSYELRSSNGDIASFHLNEAIDLSNLTLQQLASYVQSSSSGVTLEYNGRNIAGEQVDSSYDQAQQWINNRVAAGSGQLGLSMPTPVPYTLDGTKLNTHPLTGGLVLPDGVPYTGDVTYKVPAITAQAVDGVPTAVYTDSAGNVVSIETGAIVVPADVPVIGDITDITPVPVPTTGGFGATTTALDFSPLIVASSTLTTKFPFSLPWDIFKQLSVFDVTPQTPKFEIDIDEYLKLGNISIPMRFDLDFSMFDTLASVIRWFNLIIWDIALILIIRKILPE